MATEYIKISGKVKWFKHDRLNKFNKWSHDLYPDPTGLDKLRELQAEGVKNVMRKDDDGYNMTISRPPEITVKGLKRGMLPPVITNKDDKPFTGNVGNGSQVTTTLEVYGYRAPGEEKKKKAIRWYSTRIDDLIPFSMNELMPHEQDAVTKSETADSF